MNAEQTPTVEAPQDQSQSNADLQEGLAHRSEAIKAVTQADKVAGREYKVDISGNVLTPTESDQELAYRNDHGGLSSNETATN